MKAKYFYSFFGVLSLVFCDLFTKHFVFQASHTPLLKTWNNAVFNIYSTCNEGAAWSILSGQKWLLIIIAILAITLLLQLIYQNITQRKPAALLFGYILILAGAIGNMYDRLTLGCVRDFIQLDFIHFPIFNIADICLTIGVISWLLITLKNKDL